jgi:hypothetical protein
VQFHSLHELGAWPPGLSWLIRGWRGQSKSSHPHGGAGLPLGSRPNLYCSSCPGWLRNRPNMPSAGIRSISILVCCPVPASRMASSSGAVASRWRVFGGGPGDRPFFEHEVGVNVDLSSGDRLVA